MSMRRFPGLALVQDNTFYDCIGATGTGGRSLDQSARLAGLRLGSILRSTINI